MCQTDTVANVTVSILSHHRVLCRSNTLTPPEARVYFAASVLSGKFDLRLKWWSRLCCFPSNLACQESSPPSRVTVHLRLILGRGRADSAPDCGGSGRGRQRHGCGDDRRTEADDRVMSAPCYGALQPYNQELGRDKDAPRQCEGRG